MLLIYDEEFAYISSVLCLNMCSCEGDVVFVSLSCLKCVWSLIAVFLFVSMFPLFLLLSLFTTVSHQNFVGICRLTLGSPQDT